MEKIKTFGDLKKAKYKVLPIKQEMRKNLILKLKKREELFPGIIGYDETVIPEIENAVLSSHDMIFLGERGQAKTRIMRLLTNLLDPYVPKVKGCEVPFTVPLRSPIGGPDLEIALEGYFDLIEEDGTIVEYKTSAIALSASDIDARIQLTAYSYAYQLLFRKSPKGIRVVDFVKGKKPKIVVIETKRDKNDHLGFLHTAQEVLKGIKAEIFIPRQSFWCKECEYADICPLFKNKATAPKAESLYAA